MKQTGLKFGDLIYLFHNSEAKGKKIDCNGFMGIKGAHEIIKQSIKMGNMDLETEGSISGDIFHPYMIPSLNQMGRMSEESFPSNFQWACLFRIKSTSGGNVGQPIRYGNSIRLLHTGTERYISTSKQNNSVHYVITLKAKKDAFCDFTILPKYKVRTEGEQVFYNDNIVLQNNIQSQYLSILDFSTYTTTGRGEKYTKIPESHSVGGQLILKHKPQGWKLKAFSSSSSSNDLIDQAPEPTESESEIEEAMRAGDYCRLFHREIEGFIGARINDLNSLNPISRQPIVNIKLRATKDKKAVDCVFEEFLGDREEGEKAQERYYVHLRRSGAIKKSKTPRGSLTIFQFEHEIQDDGGILLWNSPIRLRHIASGFYLALGESLVLLPPDSLDASSLFIFIPLASENSVPYITYKSYARIQALSSKLYLSGSSGALSINALQMLDDDDRQGGSMESDIGGGSQSGSGSLDNTETLSQRSSSTLRTQQTVDGPNIADIKNMMNRYKEKESAINLIDHSSDEDIFRIQNVKKDDVKNLQPIAQYKNLLLIYLPMITELKTEGSGGISPPLPHGWLIQLLNKTLESLIIQLISLPKHWSGGYEKLKNLCKNHKPKTIKQKLMIEQYILPILFKLIKDLWEAYFRTYYEQKEASNHKKLDKLSKHGILHVIFGKNSNLDSSGENVIKEMESTCAYAHLLLTLIVRNNRDSLIIINEFDIMETLIEQIKTPWPLCLTELFQIRDVNELHIKILKKNEIKKLIDNLYLDVKEERHNHEILNLLAHICTPGDKGDMKLQNYILEMIIGKNSSYSDYESEGFNGWNIWNSCFLFYITKDKDDESLGYNIYLSSKSKQRPPYIVPVLKEGQKKFEILEYEKPEISHHQEIYSIQIENFLSTEEIPTDCFGRGLSKPLLQKKKQYFRSQMKLLGALCQDINKEAQNTIKEIFPPETLLFCLNSPIIAILDKKIMLDLLNNLYLKYNLLNALPRSLMPTIFTLKKDKNNKVPVNMEKRNSYGRTSSQSVINQDHDYHDLDVNYDLEEERIEERFKIFSLTYFNHDITDTEPKKKNNIEDSEVKEDEKEENEIKIPNIWPKSEFDSQNNSEVGAEIEKPPGRLLNKVGNIFKRNLQQKRAKNWKKVKENRIQLHEFVITMLENIVDWDSNIDTLQFYVTFFETIRFLILRKFFDPNYNLHIDKELKAIGEFCEGFFSLKRSTLRYRSYMPENLRPRDQLTEETSYNAFFLTMKYNLINTLKLCKPQYFIKQEKISDIKNLGERFKAKTPKAHYISMIQIEICRILYTIYDIYQEKAVMGVWDVFKAIMRKWVKHNSSVKQEEARNKTQNTSFSFIRDTSTVSAIGLLRKSTSGSRRPSNRVKPAEQSAEVKFEDAVGTKRKRRSTRGRSDLFDSAIAPNRRNTNKRGINFDEDSDSDPENENENEDSVSSEEKEVEELKIVQYKDISKLQKKQAKPLIREFVCKYIRGEFTCGAMGKMKELDKDEIVDVLSDMLLSNNPELNVKAMDLLYRHFNQFSMLLSSIRKALIVDEQEDHATYIHILTLQHTFKTLAGGSNTTLTKDQDVLSQLHQLFLTPSHKLEHPGLKELVFAAFWAYKCKGCGRWYRSKLQTKTKENEIFFREDALKCYEEHQEDISQEIIRYTPTSFDIVAINQELLRDANVHITVLKFLEEKGLLVANSVREKYDQNQINLFNECFEFIFYFIKNHENNCLALTHKKWIKMFSVFLSHKMFREKALKILTELVIDNDAANKMIHEDDIGNLIHDAADSGSTDFCELIDLFKALVESEVRIIKDRQIYIIRNIEIYFVKKEGWCSVDELLLKEGNISANDAELPKLLLHLHNQILDSKEDISTSEDFLGFPDPELKAENCLLYKHIYFVDLIGLCAKGKNAFTEAFCRKVLPTQRMLNVILDRELPLYIRIPYLRFLEGVYFSVEETGEEESTQSATRKFDEVNIINVLTNTINLRNFRMILDDWTKALLYFNENIYVAKKEAIENANDLEGNSRKALEVKVDFYEYYIIDVLLPLIGDIFETANLEALWDKGFVTTNIKSTNTLTEEDDEITQPKFLKGWNVGDMNNSKDYQENKGMEDISQVTETVLLSSPDRAPTSLDTTTINEIKVDHSLKNFLRMIENWVTYICIMGSDHLVIANDSRRDTILEVLSIFKKNLKLGSKIKNSGIFDKKEYSILNVIDNLKFLTAQNMEEDIRLENKRMKIKYIKKNCMSALSTITAKEMFKQVYSVAHENERAQLIIMNTEMFDEILPEFYSFIKYFREKLFAYELFRNNNEINELNLTKQLSGKFELTEGKKTKFTPNISFIEPHQQLVIEGKKYYLHKKFRDFSMDGGLIFLNVIKLLKNLKIKAKLSTDTGFLKMMQAILILQGAKIRVINQQEKLEYDFVRNKADDVPEHLEVIQNAFSDLKTDDLILVLISNAYKKLGAKKPYFRKLLNEAVKLGLCLVSYGNEHVQNSFKDDYSTALSKFKTGQNFFQGMNTILLAGRKVYLSKSPDKLIQHLFTFSCFFIQNLCEGHNLIMKDFLREQEFAGANVDLVAGLGKICVSMCRKIQKKISYIDQESGRQVQEAIGIRYITDTKEFRTFIDWGDTPDLPKHIDLLAFRQVLRTMIEVVQGPSIFNQASFIQQSNVVQELTQILRFIGAYFYIGNIYNSKFQGNIVHDMTLIAAVANAAGLKVEADDIQSSLEAMSSKNQLVKGETVVTKGKGGLDPMRFHKRNRDLKSQPNLLREKETYQKELLQIEISIMIFFSALIEGRTSGRKTNEADEECMHRLSETLDPNILIENLNQHFHVSVHKRENLEKQALFLYYSFLTVHSEIATPTSSSSKAITKKFIKWKRQQKNEERLKNIMGRIEIINGNKNIDVVYFPIPQNVIKYWRTSIISNYRDELIDNVIRDNPEEKVKDFFAKSELLIYAVAHRAKIAKAKGKLCGLGFLLYYALTWNSGCLFLCTIFSLGINLFMLFTIQTREYCPEEYISSEGVCLDGKKERKIDENKIYGDSSFEDFVQDYGLIILGVINLLMLFWLVIIHFVNRTWLKIIMALDDLQYEGSIKGKKQKIKPWRKAFTILTTIIKDALLFYIVIMIMPILGMSVHKIYFAFTLMLIIWEGNYSRYILMSVYDHWRILLVTIMVSIIFFYWFAILTFFSSWRGEYAFEDQMNCDTLYDCFRIHMDYGFMAFPIWNEQPAPTEAIAFNFTFVLVSNLIIAAIISGIIIDSFSEKRSKKAELDDDTQNTCFICNIDREEFDHFKIDFKRHIAHYHNMWHYVWFMMHLEETPREEYTGYEEFIWDLYQEKNSSFFPIKQSLQITGHSKQKKSMTSLFNKVNKGFSNINKVMKRMVTIEYIEAKFKELDNRRMTTQPSIYDHI